MGKIKPEDKTQLVYPLNLPVFWQVPYSHLFDPPSNGTSPYCKIKVRKLDQNGNFDNSDEKNNEDISDCFSINLNTKSNIEESLIYFHLSVGNKWIYDHLWVNFDNDTIFSNIVINVLKDSVLTNAKKYYKINTNYDILSYQGNTTFWARIDSFSGIVSLLYTPDKKYENIIFSLSAVPEDTIKYADYTLLICNSVTRDQFAGNLRIVKEFKHQDFWTHYSNYLMENIGLYRSERITEYGNEYSFLKGAIINNEIIGDTSTATFKKN